MSNLTQRLITGSIFVAVLVSAIWFSVWSCAALFLLIAILGLLEFYRLSEKAGAHPQKFAGTFIGACVIVAAFLLKSGMHPSVLTPVAMLVFLLFFAELFRKKENPFAGLAWTMLGIIYIAVPFAMLVYKSVPPKQLSGPFMTPAAGVYDPRPVLMIFILIWISDSMAYVCGRLFGKHKLFERISPKKTWEGFTGGLLFTGVFAFFICGWMMKENCTMETKIMWVITGVVISITGTLGDLTESLFKRSIGVKDSGTILPGHGGILDRFDALLLATPFALFTQYVFTNYLLHRLF
ncbi:MAG TPA: phosphatidate cytidylyltransferase [Bacteroidia bacterium]|nr:phosphatidate cytidylyltransferase [Bacteroidia bacterium]